MCDDVEQLVTAAVDGQSFRVGFFWGTNCVWSGAIGTNAQDRARSVHNVLQSQIAESTNSMPAQGSRLDLALREAIRQKPDVIILFTSGEEYGKHQHGAVTTSARWTASDASGFILETWQEMHHGKIPSSFSVTCIGSCVDAQGAAYYHVISRVVGREYVFAADVTRPIYHKCDETIRGHVFCSFLAILLKTELESRMSQMDLSSGWGEVIRGLNALQEVKAVFNGHHFLLRSQLAGDSHKAIRAAGVAVPPTIKEL